MEKTTIAGAFTALCLVAFWLLTYAWHIVVPSEVQTFIGTFGLSIIAFFTDPQSIRQIPTKIFIIIAGAITIGNYLLKTIWGIILPDTIITALQVISIFLFSYFVKDVQQTATN